MAILAAILVFFVVAAGTVCAAARLFLWHGRAVDRLGVHRAAVEPVIPSPALIWRELVKRVGSFVPPSPKDAPLLKRRLIRAGYRNPGAARIFRGARAISAVLFGAAGFLLVSHTQAEGVNAVLLWGAAVAIGYQAPMQLLLFRLRRRKRAIERALPNALDLMVVCVESGLGLDQTTVQVAKELQAAYPAIAEEFTVMNLELRAGKRRADALHNLADRTGVEDLKKLVAVLIQTDRFGTSIAQTLRGHSEYMRAMARQRAEEKAAKLAVKLVFPIFFCILPSLFVVTVGPVAARLVRDLLPMIDRM